MALEYLDLSGLQHFKERQDLSNAATFATTSYVTQLVGSVTAGVYQYKGSKATVAELPSSGNRTGDVYDVAATGMNYAWNGSAWDALGTSYSAATQSVPGLMSAADKAKLDGVAAGANKTIVDTALSTTSGNPVQNKVVKAALDAMDTTAIPTSAIDALFV